MREAGAPEFTPCPDANFPASMSSSMVRHPTFQGTLLDLLAFSLCRTTTPIGDGRSLRKLLKRRLERLHRKVLSDGKRFASLPEAHQHRVRKRLKRLRYLSEFVRPLFKHRKVDRYLEALNPAQDALGAYNDRVVALDMWRRHAQTEQKAWFAVGWLSADRDQAMQTCQEALRKVGKSTRFWPPS
jgi:CHAD domain-containing protein